MIGYKFWSVIYNMAFKRIQRYQLQELTDHSLLDRYELEYDDN